MIRVIVRVERNPGATVPADELTSNFMLSYTLFINLGVFNPIDTQNRDSTSVVEIPNAKTGEGRARVSFSSNREPAK